MPFSASIFSLFLDAKYTKAMNKPSNWRGHMRNVAKSFVHFSVVYNYRRQFIGAQNKIRSEKRQNTNKHTKICLFIGIFVLVVWLYTYVQWMTRKSIVAETVTHVKSTGDGIFFGLKMLMCVCARDLLLFLVGYWCATTLLVLLLFC